jgi:phosphoribosyl-AMP cyclohydrolase
LHAAPVVHATSSVPNAFCVSLISSARRAINNWFEGDFECAVRDGWMGGSYGVMLAQVIAARRSIGRNPMSASVPEIPAFSQPDGLITAVAQDAATGRVLMVAHMNREAWLETLATGRAVYFSRSRGRLWRKGEKSGNIQHVKDVFIDCDGDAVLLKVEQVGGAACHEGYPSCFFREVTPNGLRTVDQRVFDPETVYGKE